MANRSSRTAFGCVLLLFAACESPIAQSHIEAHVPDTNSFTRFLERDLKAYFEQTLQPGQVLRIEHQLLRDGPTQTGIAFPKYYVWVKVHAAKGVVAEGAVRVAAVDRERFDVTDFLPRAEILAEPTKVQMVFPKALNDKITALARK